MTRVQRLRVCCNLSQLIQTAPSDRLLKSYRRQLDAAKSRLQQKEQPPQETTA